MICREDYVTDIRPWTEGICAEVWLWLAGSSAAAYTSTEHTSLLSVIRTEGDPEETHPTCHLAQGNPEETHPTCHLAQPVISTMESMEAQKGDGCKSNLSATLFTLTYTSSQEERIRHDTLMGHWTRTYAVYPARNGPFKPASCSHHVTGTSPKGTP